MMQQRLLILIGICLIAAAGCSRVTKASREPERHMVLEIAAPPGDREAATNRTIATIESRLNALGVVADVYPQGASANGRIIVNLWRVSDIDRLKKIITAQGKLELTHVISNPSPAPFKTYAG